MTCSPPSSAPSGRLLRAGLVVTRRLVAGRARCDQQHAHGDQANPRSNSSHRSHASFIFVHTTTVRSSVAVAHRGWRRTSCGQHGAAGGRRARQSRRDDVAPTVGSTAVLMSAGCAALCLGLAAISIARRSGRTTTYAGQLGCARLVVRRGGRRRLSRPAWRSSRAPAEGRCAGADPRRRAVVRAGLGRVERRTAGDPGDGGHARRPLRGPGDRAPGRPPRRVGPRRGRRGRSSPSLYVGGGALRCGARRSFRDPSAGRELLGRTAPSNACLNVHPSPGIVHGDGTC